MSVSRFFRVVRERLRAVFRKDTLDAELERELTFHLELLTQEFVERGMPHAQARQAARKALGNVSSLEEQCRDQRAVSWVHDLRRDVIYGARMLRRSPGFTLVAVVSLALGIGANTATLSVMHAMLRDGLPVPHDERLVVLRTFQLDTPSQESHALLVDYYAWRDENRSFDLVGAAMGHNADFGAEDGVGAERLPGQSVTPDTLRALGVEPLLGRLFTEPEGQVEPPERVILISHRLWQRRYGARPDIIGQIVRLDRVNRTIVGVMPERFRFPNEGVEYWIPFRPDRSEVRTPQRFYVVTARLKPGVTIEQAQSDVNVISARLTRDDPDRHAGWSVRVKPLREAMFGWTAAPLFTLQAAVTLLLLVACANLAGLLLARGLVRMPEIALRTALGATRGRIARQLLTESMLLSLVGGMLGMFVAWAGIRAIAAMNPPPGTLRIIDLDIDLRTLGIAALVSIAAGTLFGVAPALLGAESRVATTLRESPTGAARGLPRFRSGLVAAQIAVTFVLLIGSGLLMKSFVQLVSRDLRFDPERLLTFEYHMPLSDYLHRQGSFQGLPYFRIDPPPSLTLERLYEGLRGVPGVESVAGTSFPLLNALVLPSVTVSVDSGDALPPPAQHGGSTPSLAIAVGNVTHASERQAPNAVYFLVTPRFFTAIKAQLIEGRDFDEHDTAADRWVVIVNESAAVRLWPGQRVLGRRLRLTNVPDERPREVVAVVRDIPLTRQGAPRPVIYASYRQQPVNYPQLGANMFGRMTFMVRTTGNPMSVLPAARRLVAEIDPDRPLANVTTMEDQLGAVIPQRGYFVLALTAFALVAMLLAGVGVYGVMSYSVTQRTREIGVRVALGAGRREVVRLVGTRVLVVTAIGLAAGLGGALALTQLLRSQLWGVTPTDRATFVAVVVLLISAALLACVLPLRRATSVDPTVALRGE